MSARRRVGLTAFGLLALAGCSQTKALAPVGGNRLSEVRFAAIDVLIDNGVEIMVAPVCVASAPDDDEIACQGTTLDEQPITAVSHADDQDHLLVIVGATTIYNGPVQAVLTSAARPTG